METLPEGIALSMDSGQSNVAVYPWNRIKLYELDEVQGYHGLAYKEPGKRSRIRFFRGRQGTASADFLKR